MYPFQGLGNQSMLNAAPSVVQNIPLHRLPASRMFSIQEVGFYFIIL